MFYGMIHDMLCVASSVKINLFQWIFKARGSQVEDAMKLINYHHTFSQVLLRSTVLKISKLTMSKCQHGCRGRNAVSTCRRALLSSNLIIMQSFHHYEDASLALWALFSLFVLSQLLVDFIYFFIALIVQ